MASIVPLQVTPNQSFSVRLDGARYDLTLQAAGNIMAVTIVRDGVTLLTGARVVAGMPLLPYRHLARGNFLFITEGAEPWWELFGTQTLLVLSAAEIAAL